MKNTKVHVEFWVELPENREDGSQDGEEYALATGRPIPFATAREFIVDALESWGGQLHPLDPLYDGLKPHNLRLKRAVEPRGGLHAD